jgi:membrane-associated protease RseP (regulator of RpoE activity)
MHRVPVVLFALALGLLASAGLFAQQPAPGGPPHDDLGLKLVAVPAALYAHVPALEHGQGLLVETLKPGSRAAELGLKPYDIVLAVGTTPVKSADAFAGKVRALPLGEREVLQIIRGGKPFALTVASPTTTAESYTPAKSLFKPGGPPAVSVEIKPLPAGALAVNVFYLNTANKMQRHALTGSLADIERQVGTLAENGTMPASIHDLVSVALQRARTKTPAQK